MFCVRSSMLEMAVPEIPATSPNVSSSQWPPLGRQGCLIIAKLEPINRRTTDGMYVSPKFRKVAAETTSNGKVPPQASRTAFVDIWPKPLIVPIRAVTENAPMRADINKMRPSVSESPGDNRRTDSHQKEEIAIPDTLPIIPAVN